MKLLHTILLALMLLACSTACTAAPAVKTGLKDVAWKLETYLDAQGQAVNALPDSEVTLEFSADQVNGSAGCNRYFASYTLAGQKLTLGPAGATMMACDEPRMAQESAFLAALGQVVSYRIQSGKLELLDAAGKVQLVMTELKPLPLVGTAWVMSAVNNGQEAVTSPLAEVQVTAAFGADGKVSGSAGCNTYTGSYQVEGEKMTIGALGVTRMACAAPDGIMDQETAFLQALQKAAVFKIRSHTLEIRDGSGALLASFNAAP